MHKQAFLYTMFLTIYIQVLLYEGSFLDFLNNTVSELGAGIYVEFLSSDFVFTPLNAGCFIRYFSELVGLQPTEWVCSFTNFFVYQNT